MRQSVLASNTATPALNHEQTGRLATAVADFTVDQLQWASGYLAGLAAATGQVAVTPEAVEQETLTILYGSQTGNGKAVALELEERARQQGLAVRCQNLADFRPAQLAKERLIALVVSTHGEGDPPDDAEEFHEFLHGRKAPRLEQLHYTVLALGDSSYQNYCQTGVDLDERLEALGATRLLPRVDCDVDYQAGAQEWAGGVLEQAAERLDGVVTANRPAAQLHAVATLPLHGRGNPYHAELLTNQKITGRYSAKDIRHIEFSLEGSGLSYEPGDALAVIPRNPKQLVEEILEVSGLPADEPVSLDEGDLPLARALTEKFEITALNRRFIEGYAELTGTSELRQLLARPEALSGYLGSRQIVDVLHEHGGRLSADEFVGTLRPLTHRLYSIASSAVANPDEVHLTVGVVDYEAFGRNHLGAASGFLARLAEDQQAPVYVEPNERFRLPEDDDRPIIMVGPGTGIAPFRAFIEERAARGARGRNWLFFGDQHFSSDFLYQLEWLRYRKQGQLHRVDTAFSRDQAHKIYVQHRMLERGRELFDWLENGAHFYVCGDGSRMAPDVHDALLQITRQEGGLSEEAAEDYLRQLKRDGRYLRDVY